MKQACSTVKMFRFMGFRYEKAAQDREKVEDELRRKPPPSDGPELPSTVSKHELNDFFQPFL